MLRTAIVTLLATASLSGSAAWASGDPQETGTMRVSVSGLDLNSSTGARMALARIRDAARGFCGDPGNIMDLARRAETRACYTHMTYLAVAKLDAPLVTAAFAGSPLAPSIRLARR